jgi:thioredoxin-related protein
MKATTIFLTTLMVLAGVLFPKHVDAQPSTYQFEQLDSLQKVEQRTVLVWIHTDWCKYCKAMQNTSFKHRDIVQLLNKHFYLLDLDAEEQRGIRFHGHTFQYKPTGHQTGMHELAEQLGTIEGKISFPSLCFLNEKNEIIYQHSGFLDAKALQKILEELK